MMALWPGFFRLCDVDQIFNVNIKGVFTCTRAVLPSMIERKYGKIINMSSVTGPLVANAGECAYAAT